MRFDIGNFPPSKLSQTGPSSAASATGAQCQSGSCSNSQWCGTFDAEGKPTPVSRTLCITEKGNFQASLESGAFEFIECHGLSL